jgi:aspartyl protease family protein
MNGDDNAQLIYSLLAIMLLISSLSARRLPLKQTVKMALAWVAIFAVGLLVASFFV